MRFRLIAAILTTAVFAAPACATTYQVGTGQTYTTFASLPALVPDDVVEVQPGTHNDVWKMTSSGTVGHPITIRGVGASRPIIDATGFVWLNGSGPNGRGAFHIEGNYVVIEHLEVVNAHNGDLNAAGIIVVRGDSCVIRDCSIHDNDDGIFAGELYTLTVDGCEVYHNGHGSSYAHNFYVAGDHIIIKNCYVHDSDGGLNIKTRAHYNEILYNYIYGSADGEIQFCDEIYWEVIGSGGTLIGTGAPNSNALLMGNLIVAKAAGRNVYGNYRRFIDFGSDNSGSGRDGTLYMVNNTLVAGWPAIYFVATTHANAGVVAVNNIFYGSDHIIAPSSDWADWYVSSATRPMTGDHNWVHVGADVPAGFTDTIQGYAPGFVDYHNLDMRLGSWSTSAKDGGRASVTAVDGSGTTISAVPQYAYAAPLTAAPRTIVGTIDVGAYEVASGVATPAQRTLWFDFGTETSPLKAGWTRVGDTRDDGALYTRETGFGWLGTGGINTNLVSRDRGAIPGTDDMSRDLHIDWYGHDSTFAVDLPVGGTYDVAMTLGDADGARPPIDVYINGTKVDTVTTGSSFVTNTYTVTAVDPRFDFRFVNGTDGQTCVDGIAISPAAGGGGTPPSVTSPLKYDFGTSTSPVMSGYTQVTEATYYTLAAGYGWTADDGLVSRDRWVDLGSAAGDDLTRDMVVLHDATFTVNLPPGIYDVTYVAHDAEYTRDQMGVDIEGVQVDTVTAVNTDPVVRTTYRVPVADGQLTFRVHDLGGDYYSVIDGLEIAVVSGLPSGKPVKRPVILHRGRGPRGR